MDRCDGCGFVDDESEAAAAARRIVEESAALAAAVLDLAAATDVRARLDPATWSPLEYACHVRDVLLVQRERVLAARRQDRPSTTPMGRDERVEHDGYADQDPADVARQLVDAARLFANVLDRVAAAGAWSRTLVYNYPAPAERSLRWVAVHTLHEVRHHRADVSALAARAGGGS